MKALSLAICLLALSSCASTPQSRQIRTDWPGPLPLAVELTDTPFYPQTQHQCGPAALATVLQAHSVETTPELLSSKVYIPDRQGSLQIEMAAAARQYEMLPYPLRPVLTELFTEIAAGNPVLVLQNLGFDWFPQWHYAVVIGYDINNNEIILRSGTHKRWITTFEVFERSWERADFWALVIVPLDKIPDSAEPLRYLKTAYTFEETGKPELALKAYQTASRQWPEVTATWIALGNTAFNRQNWPLAVSAFSTAATLEADSIISWNNLAYALHSYGCKTQALQALQCALNISPTDSNLRDSQMELSNTPATGKRNDCPFIRCD